MNVAVSREQISDLVLLITPLSPSTSVNDVAKLFLTDEFRELLCLPIVVDEKVVGTISRHAVMRFFIMPFGREIYGANPIEQWMNREPLLIDSNTDIETASSYVREHLTNPITEDFVITKNGNYLGMGIVLSLLELLELRAKRRNQDLLIVNNNLKNSQARLIQSEKMASLGQMVAGVAHEINTPLGYVHSNLEVAQQYLEQMHLGVQSSQALVNALASGDVGEDDFHQLLTASHQQLNDLTEQNVFGDLVTLFEDSLYGLDQIGELVVGLRNFSRTDHSRTQTVNVNECVESSLTIGRNIIKQKADVELDLGENIVIEGVAAQINQVLLNIFTNAAQAIPVFGVIKVKTIGYEKYVDITIQDNGCGMPESVRKKIFDPFFTTKKVGEGTGLGLSISYQIIQQHHGIIDAKSIEGKGTKFIIRLPRKQPKQTSDAPLAE